MVDSKFPLQWIVAGLVVIAIILIVIFMGGRQPQANGAIPTIATPASQPALIQVKQNPVLGQILTSSNGMTLYLFTKDAPEASNCNNQCAVIWPPLLSNSTPVLAQPLEGNVGTIQRSDGTSQATFGGWPLYYYQKDLVPGDIKGQGFGGVWYVATPSMTFPAAVSPPPQATPTPIVVSVMPSPTPSPSVSASTVPLENKAVSIQNFAFSPASLTVPVGTTVIWTNMDSTTHTVAANSGTFSSQDIVQGATYSFTFIQAGTYAYHCGIHPGMTGTIIVTS